MNIFLNPIYGNTKMENDLVILMFNLGLLISKYSFYDGTINVFFCFDSSQSNLDKFQNLHKTLKASLLARLIFFSALTMVKNKNEYIYK